MVKEHYRVGGMIFYVFIYIPSTRGMGILSIRILALLKFGGNDYLLAGDDYLPALPWFDNAVSTNELG